MECPNCTKKLTMYPEYTTGYKRVHCICYTCGYKPSLEEINRSFEDAMNAFQKRAASQRSFFSEECIVEHYEEHLEN